MVAGLITANKWSPKLSKHHRLVRLRVSSTRHTHTLLSRSAWNIGTGMLLLRSVRIAVRKRGELIRWHLSALFGCTFAVRVPGGQNAAGDNLPEIDNGSTCPEQAPTVPPGCLRHMQLDVEPHRAGAESTPHSFAKHLRAVHGASTLQPHDTVQLQAESWAAQLYPSSAL